MDKKKSLKIESKAGLGNGDQDKSSLVFDLKVGRINKNEVGGDVK